PGMGSDDGEGVERGWSWANSFAPSTKEMGPGSRRDLLDIVFGHWNWSTVITMRSSRIKIAIPKRETHTDAFQAFTESIPKWMRMVTAWEADPRDKSNPYVARHSRTCLLQLTLLAAHIVYIRPHISRKVSSASSSCRRTPPISRKGRLFLCTRSSAASTPIVVGLELEDQQRRLRADLAGLGEATLQAQNTTLFLPSAVCARHVVSTALLNHEWRLREAQAHDALSDLRRHLEVRAYVFKDTHGRGEREDTRSKTNSIQAKLALNTERYRAAFTALCMVAIPLGKTNWQSYLQKLEDSHICHIHADDGSGIGSRHISWIWYAGGSALVFPTGVLNVGVNRILQE
ncbi:hypothetical protein LXA43DRAFT_901665, partial [Ganoderma leucocontextum]